jgi:nitroreductase
MDDVETVDRVLMTTRSVRRRIDFERPIEPEVLEACIACAVQAPTGLNREAWRFVVVTDARRKEQLADLYRNAFNELGERMREELRAQGEAPPPLRPGYQSLADRLQDFPALILVCSMGRPGPELARQIAFFGSVLPAAWSLMLALRARGIGATWTSLLAQHERETREALEIPQDVTPTVMLPAGYLRNATLRPAERRAPHEVTYWNGWGAARGA